jgi:8-oxo-dGTP pyrophosphatase MutT (NUDIX family)
VHENEKQYWQQIHEEYLHHAQLLGKDRLVVSAVIYAHNKVLLVRRAAHDSYPGMWEFPGGGVDENLQEHVVDALRREVLEETGISLPTYPSGVVLVHPTRTAVRVVLRFDIDDIPEVSLSDEHDEMLFASLDESKNIDSSGNVIYDTMRPENQGILLLVLGAHGVDE